MDDLSYRLFQAFIATSLLLCASSAVTGQFYANEPSFFRPSYRGARQNEQYLASPPQPNPAPAQPKAYPQPQPQYDEPASYAFEWQVQDDYTKNNYGHKENREDTITNGEYYVLLPDGRTQKVTYTVDGYNGYQAEVSYEGEAQYPAEAPKRPAYPQSEYRAAASEPEPTYKNAAPVQTYPQPTSAPAPAYPQRSPAPVPSPAYPQRSPAPAPVIAPSPSYRYTKTQPQPAIRRYSYKPAPVEEEKPVEQDQSPAESQEAPVVAEGQDEYQSEEPQAPEEQPAEKEQTYETYYKYF